jgi:23S rRNA pseudouridine1911/1915/1917 synthase
VVPAGPARRLDQFLAAHFDPHSRRRAREVIAAGAVQVNGRLARKGDVLQPGDSVSLRTGMPGPAELTPQPELALAVLFQDDCLIAVDKPAGMPSVALRSADRDTLANALVGHLPELGAAGRNPLEAGLVHRLDSATSGVVLAARTRTAWLDLREQFDARAVHKLYSAVVAGDVARAGTIDTPIAHHPRRRRLMVACPNADQARTWQAQPAITHYRPLERFGTATLLAVTIATGVRHQIRVHLAALGHAILGDAPYGSARPGRLMLHATRLRVRHPVQRGEVTISCPPPAEFAAALDRLRTAR